MTTKLEDLSYKLNSHATDDGTRFDALLAEDGETLEVVCTENPDFPIYVTATDQQILAVTPLFSKDAIAEKDVNELNDVMLKLSPVIPLSSLGLQNDTYILYGAMAVNTVFENITHELEMQAINTLEVLDALKTFLKQQGEGL